jgi:hypothetical protein
VGRGAALSKVGLRARSAPGAETAVETARKIANRDRRIWIAKPVNRTNPGGGEKFWFCGWRAAEEQVSGNGTGFVWYGEGWPG